MSEKSGKTAIPPELQAGMKANAIAYHHPALKATMEIFKTALSMPIEAELVRPTALAEKLSETRGETWTAIRVNKLLVEQGFQIKNPEELLSLIEAEAKSHSFRMAALQEQLEKVQQGGEYGERRKLSQLLDTLYKTAAAKH